MPAEEKACQNCRYIDVPVVLGPCGSCSRKNTKSKLDNWEEKEKNNMTLKEMFVNAANGAENCKVILGIRMPDGTKEMIINDNVQNKVDYVCGKYDDDLKMIGAPIYIEEFLFIKK